jgi:biopolymer transport protein ExbB
MMKLSRPAGVAALAFLIVLQGVPARAQQPAATGGEGHAPIPAPPALSSPPATVPVVPMPSPPADGPVAPPSSSASKPLAGVGPLQELSPWSMFLSADILVKAVMIGLAFASLVTWTLLLAKTFHLARARRDLGGALSRIAKKRSLSEAQSALGSTDNVLSDLLAAAVEEVQLSDAAAQNAGVKERAASRFSEVARAEARAARSGMAIIATIGATAPFVGLFGTVWGIMNSFIGISKAQTTNLAVVAPGIAEALLATAVGLATAIPAVIIYNHFSRATKSYLELVGRGSGAIGRLLSRDLDRFHGRTASRAAE